MIRIQHIARREWLEQWRQPWMLAAIGALYAAIAALVVFVVVALEVVSRIGSGAKIVESWLASTPSALVGTTLALFDFLMFTQLLGIAAVVGGHAILHDRQSGTLPFLLLAPVHRMDLLAGKVIGALGWPILLYLVIDGIAAVALSVLPITSGHGAYLPRSLAFWVAFSVGAPAWAVFLGGVCTLLSAVARDVRTAQQGVWLAVFFTSIFAGGLLTWGLAVGLLAEMAVAALGVTAAAVTLRTGAQYLARDLAR